MAYPIPFNKRGIYGIRSVGTPTVTATDITFKFEEHPYVQMPYNGILIVNITTGAPIGGTAVPVFFQTGNYPKVAVTKENGSPLLSTDVEASGYYLLFFDRTSGVLQTLNSVV